MKTIYRKQMKTIYRKQTKTIYRNIGPVRGFCGHDHRTLNGAVECLKRDQRDCSAHGGYSDRNVRKYVDGLRVTMPEKEALEFSYRLKER